RQNLHHFPARFLLLPSSRHLTSSPRRPSNPHQRTSILLDAAATVTAAMSGWDEGAVFYSDQAQFPRGGSGGDPTADLTRHSALPSSQPPPPHRNIAGRRRHRNRSHVGLGRGRRVLQRPGSFPPRRFRRRPHRRPHPPLRPPQVQGIPPRLHRPHRRLPLPV